ncbi:MAG: SIMPL domain-containing protein, partial [Phenylobacterium sp.]|nr:SIMPL domain-containing protein [Phenylobacterium sp.]
MVRLRNIDRMGQMIDALVSAGANEVNGPNFAVEDLDEAADEARADALRRARARADLYAREAGFSSARLLTISEGSGYYPIQGDSQVITVTGQSRGAGIPPLPVPPAPVQGGQVSVSVTLSVQFALER